MNSCIGFLTILYLNFSPSSLLYLSKEPGPGKENIAIRGLQLLTANSNLFLQLTPSPVRTEVLPWGPACLVV